MHGYPGGWTACVECNFGLKCVSMGRVSSVSIVPRLKARRAKYHGSIPERGKNFVPSVFCRPSCCAGIVGDLPGEKSDRLRS